MEERVVVSEGGGRADFRIRTPGRYAMDLAVDLMEFLDRQPNVSVGNTGWKQGFGLRVADWIPIHTKNAVAELQTDGDEILIRHESGARSEFVAVMDLVRRFVRDLRR
ncbi:MAG: hypothetical protein ACF8XB_22650 [Planctomycetota bacterium JB042]